jgi:hypothetical protein
VITGTFINQTADGWVHGGHLGFNHQFGSLVAGLRSQSACDIETQECFRATRRIRCPADGEYDTLLWRRSAGAARGPFYAKGGYAGAKSARNPGSGAALIEVSRWPAADMVPVSRWRYSKTSPGASSTAISISTSTLTTGRLTGRRRSQPASISEHRARPEHPDRDNPAQFQVWPIIPLKQCQVSPPLAARSENFCCDGLGHERKDGVRPPALDTWLGRVGTEP